MIGAGDVLNRMVSPAPIAYDCRHLLGISLYDVGASVSWGEFLLLITELVKVETSRTYMTLQGLKYAPVSREGVYLLNLFASFAGVKDKTRAELMPWDSRKMPTANVSRETFEKETDTLLAQFGITR